MALLKMISLILMLCVVSSDVLVDLLIQKIVDRVSPQKDVTNDLSHLGTGIRWFKFSGSSLLDFCQIRPLSKVPFYLCQGICWVFVMGLQST